MYKAGDILIYRWQNKAGAPRGSLFHGRLFKVLYTNKEDATITIVTEVDSNFKLKSDERFPLSTKNLFPYTKQLKQEIICDKIKYLDSRWSEYQRSKGNQCAA